MSKVYDILLDGEKIGTTLLEYGDPSMGFVFGAIQFLKIGSGFEFFRDYCRKNGIEADTYPDDKLINTRNIPHLKIYNAAGKEIIGTGNNIEGADWDVFQVNIIGIPWDLYHEEFPHHVKADEERFK